MRETLGRKFDVIVVVWALALAVGWSFVTLGHDETGDTQWGHAQSGPVWLVNDSSPATVTP